MIEGNMVVDVRADLVNQFEGSLLIMQAGETDASKGTVKLPPQCKDSFFKATRALASC